jgi:uncharacterized protein YkwD
MRSTRKSLVVVAVALALAGAACAPRAAAPPPATSASGCGATALASELVALTNQARAFAGVRALSWDSHLACLATDWSRYMASTGTLQHRDLNAAIRSPAYSGYRTLGENILRGPTSMSARQMYDAWMASAAHRANILSAAYTRIGIGSATAGSTVYVTQNFGG